MGARTVRELRERDARVSVVIKRQQGCENDEPSTGASGRLEGGRT